MIVLLNDKRCEVAEGTTLAAFIGSLGIKPHGVAIAIDCEVVPKDEWKITELFDGIELVLITAVSGG